MIIHIGSRQTLTTRCGKPVTRRWWVEASQMLKTRSGVLRAKHLATCSRCGAMPGAHFFDTLVEVKSSGRDGVLKLGAPR